MREFLLLDTNSFLWFTTDDPALKPRAREAIEDADTTILVSWATAWEIGIKCNRGLLELPESPREFFENQLRENRFQETSITLDLILFSTELPWHHRDPFDRIIIAESLRNNFKVVSSDAQFDTYGVHRVW